MPTLKFPYGKATISYDIQDKHLAAELVSALHHYQAPLSEQELVNQALANPIGTPRLSVMAKNKKNVVIICSDHTRPVPSKLIIPPMLAEIRAGSPDAKITLLISTGMHRVSTDAEMISKFGEDIFNNEHIVMHDCDNSEMVHIGTLPSGGDMVINKLIVEADLVTSEGFIEPHFFAGYSGGRKSLLPGVASRVTVCYNHNAEFIAHPRARAGILEGNPIHTDMLYAARQGRLDFICNVVIDGDKKVIHAVAGDVDKAHLSGVDFLADKCQVKAVPADIVISTNGGFPLDQNIYQSVKGMSAAEVTVKEGGVIVMLAKSNDGHGGEVFHQTFRDEPNVDVLLKRFMDTPKEKTVGDQWQSQIFARILKKATLIYVSDADEQLVRDLHMTPAKTLAEAVDMARAHLNNPDATITAIPDGIAVMVVAD